ncbi:G1/S-specific cyclin-D1-like [Seriola lalandi dorsalis]|uniref:G1/S-specific cyclin-D1-like n=1 Tax=Seriola lalandi dorsalis TaxID=1841481 RepID=UPI000C6FC22C|nr:G1/S-specific cyclin-D1-like [Seriola lalandi dorsalis]
MMNNGEDDQELIEYKTEFSVHVCEIKQTWCLMIIHVLTCTFGISADVNFIASPPSMVAAGSVVAAVQGLYLKSQDASLSSQNLTNFLSQVIRSDPDCLRSCQEQIESLLESSLRQAQQLSSSTETKRVDEDVDLSCTPTDVRDINI